MWTLVYWMMRRQDRISLQFTIFKIFNSQHHISDICIRRWLPIVFIAIRNYVMHLWCFALVPDATNMDRKFNRPPNSTNSSRNNIVTWSQLDTGNCSMPAVSVIHISIEPVIKRYIFRPYSISGQVHEARLFTIRKNSFDHIHLHSFPHPECVDGERLHSQDKLRGMVLRTRWNVPHRKPTQAKW